ncbi:LLM class F420-dependent oxidoreductase [Mycetocola manganoxydans]|uniref:LLM class F420-dependent oxidoreductase n=1 Tax=Mycetocola manganoxydans TaxID=699879 RepID=A0A3L7A017_9MICO|nr:LLM class F420-dependent oxidoreductase [Mycetocola manganoxydans]RLP72991.1 LLM class F420-dependent oxidoreductase [Mycetocola manganoxydans]GHD44647.1 LLM class F420-dependent oxidoreductase [Mycetocola manganoxydans]
MRFGTFIPQGWRHDLVGIDTREQWETMSSLAAHADAGPWESIWVYDHFHTVPVPSEEATHEAWTLMSAFAATTKRVRLGQMCTCMSYRNPAYLAKVAATIDVISDGRVEMGIGGGWYEHEWRAYGYGFPSAGDRLGRLNEGVQIMKQAWETGTATLDGKHYQVDGAIVRPLPVQEGGIPFWIAGGGEKVTLRIAAKYAQYTNFDGSPEGFTHKSDILRGHCEKIGRNFDEIVRSSNYNVVIADTEAEVDERLDAIQARVTPYLGEAKAADFMAEYRSGNALGVGTPEQIVERLSGMKEKGLAYAITYFPEAAYDRSGIELFEREVIPALS